MTLHHKNLDEVNAWTQNIRMPARPRRRPIDFQAVREQVRIKDVLELLHWQPTRVRGHQWRGPCVVHQSQHPRSTIMAVNTQKDVFCCHKRGCEARGNVLDLWMAVRGMDIYPAAEDLCERLGIPVPYLPEQRNTCVNEDEAPCNALGQQPCVTNVPKQKVPGTAMPEAAVVPFGAPRSKKAQDRELAAAVQRGMPAKPAGATSPTRKGIDP